MPPESLDHLYKHCVAKHFDSSKYSSIQHTPARTSPHRGDVSILQYQLKSYVLYLEEMRQRGAFIQISANIGHSKKIWASVSILCEQNAQNGLVPTCLRIRPTRVGNISWHARQINIRTLGGILNSHIQSHSGEAEPTKLDEAIAILALPEIKLW